MPLLASCIAFLLLPGHSKDIVAKNQPSRDVWVFRSVLDKHARIATLAIAPNYWLSYDATNCGLYKFWNGGVKFDGAVYTTVHGPQPTSEGGALEEGSTEDNVWKVIVNGQTKEIKAKYRGYQFDLKDRSIVHFQYDLPFSGKTIRVNETPFLLWDGGKAVGLRRQFSVGTFSKGAFEGTTLPGVSLGLTLGKANGIFKNFQASGGKYAMANGKNELTFDGNVATVDAFFDPTTAQIDSSEIFASIDPQGGGSGSQAKGDIREKGLGFRAYQLDRALLTIPRLVPNQTPNINRKIDQIAFVDASDFGISDKFYVNISGWIKIAKAGNYQFRLGSDDGSRLVIDDKKVVDNDGIHEAKAVEGSMDLNVTSHPIRVEYFNNTPNEYLQLEWKKPGDTEWEVVPDDAFETVADEVRVVNPGFKKVIDMLFPQRPGDGLPETAVHPSFDLSTPRPKDFNPRVGGIAFYPDGRMLMCTWDANGAVYEISGVQTGDPNKVTIKRIATGLAEPLGGGQ